MNQLKNYLVWLLLLTKRYFKKPLFVLTILSIPFFSLALKNMSGEDERMMQVVLFEEQKGANPIADEAIASLCKRKSNAIQFYEVSSREMMEREVQNGNAFCGYYFPADFKTHLTNYVKHQYKGLPHGHSIVECCFLEDRAFVNLANEIIFSEIYNDFVLIAEKHFMETSNFVKDFSESDWEELLGYRNQYDNLSIDFFKFYYADGTENTLVGKDSSSSYLTLPVRGLVYVLILLAAMTGAILLFRDIESGVFGSIPLRQRSVLSYLYLLIPTGISGIVGFFGILISGTTDSIAMEIYNTILYVLMVVGFIALIQKLFRNLNQFVAILPLFIVVNMILCPVFINVQSAFPPNRYIKWILPVNYGMRGNHSLLARMIMLCVGLIGILIFLLPSLRRKETTIKQ